MRGDGPTLILRLIQEKEGSELRGSTPSHGSGAFEGWIHPTGAPFIAPDGRRHPRQPRVARLNKRTAFLGIMSAARRYYPDGPLRELTLAAFPLACTILQLARPEGLFQCS